MACFGLLSSKCHYYINISYPLTRTQGCMSENASLALNDYETDSDRHKSVLTQPDMYTQHSLVAKPNHGKAVMQIKIQKTFILYFYFNISISPQKSHRNGEDQMQRIVKITEGKKDLCLAGTQSKEHPAGVTELFCETSLPVLKTMLGELEAGQASTPVYNPPKQAFLSLSNLRLTGQNKTDFWTDLHSFAFSYSISDYIECLLKSCVMQLSHAGHEFVFAWVPVCVE